MGCFAGVEKMAWDVLSGVEKMAWDVLSGVEKMAWDVLSWVANRCVMFCPLVKNGMGCFVQGCFIIQTRNVKNLLYIYAPFHLIFS